MSRYSPFIKASRPNINDSQNICVQAKAPAIKMIPKMMGKMANILTFSMKTSLFNRSIVPSVYTIKRVPNATQRIATVYKAIITSSPLIQSKKPFSKN